MINGLKISEVIDKLIEIHDKEGDLPVYITHRDEGSRMILEDSFYITKDTDTIKTLDLRVF